jgi:hypothetical protein
VQNRGQARHRLQSDERGHVAMARNSSAREMLLAVNSALEAL